LHCDDTEMGWIFSLRDSPESNWGSVDNFYEDILSFKSSKEGIIYIQSKVWGKLQRKNFTPKEGDGIAFYHSSKAKFPPNDPYKRQQRISLIGKLNYIEYEERELKLMEFSAERRVIEILQTNPIVRDKTTKHIFENCGMVSGSVATLYKADKKEWEEILKLLRKRRDNTFVNNSLFPDELSSELSTEFIEGAKKTIIVNSYERDPNARKACLRFYDSYTCQICGFDFEKVYGEIGKEFIHVHHLKLLATLRENYKVNPQKDLIPVCPNCHAMLHRRKLEPFTPDELKEIVGHQF
jgi:5-methylcytosine-specific restriction endonuclease McrA